jgi:2-keto-3-deoxy-L-rhamnonate aldolase RhmA
MRYVTNGIREATTEGRPAIGSFISTRATQAVEMAALGGLDFIRIDAYKNWLNPEQQNVLIHYAYSMGLTPWVRSRNDPWEIMHAIDNGALVVSMKIGDPDDARKAVNAVRYPPKGTREPSRPKRYAHMPQDEYLRWYDSNVLLGLQLEAPGVIENWKELVRTDGADIIEYGKGGLAAALGLFSIGPDYFHPKNLEFEKRVVDAALEAGKQVAMHHFATEEGLQRIERWIAYGVLIHIVDSDAGILEKEYARLIDRLAPRSGIRGSA